MRPGRIALSGSDTPPLDSVTPSSYASPRDPPPIPFTATARRWSSPASPVNPLTSPPEDNKLGVRFAKSKSPLVQGLSIQISPRDLDLGLPNEAQHRSLTLIGLAFASASGTLSGMSLVLAKAAVELLVITIDHLRTGRGSNEFIRVQSWLLVAGLLIGGLLQLVYLNYSLTFASPALICPLAFCFFNLSSIFGRSPCHSLLPADVFRWPGILRPVWPTPTISNRPRFDWRCCLTPRRLGCFSYPTYRSRRCRCGYMGRRGG